MSSNAHFFDDFSLGNELFDPQMDSSAFLESQSNQVYPNFSNFVQFISQGDSQSQDLCLRGPTQSHDSLKSNDVLEPLTHQPEITQMPPSALEGSVEEASVIASGNNEQTKDGISLGWWEKANVRRQWSKDEDMLLVRLVGKYGDKNWARIAEKFTLRIGKQCRDRWRNGLRPNIMKNAWSEEDDMLLIELHKHFGNKWADIATNMPGRSENSIKNHWNGTKRRNYSSKSHHNKTNKYRLSLLKDYITSLTLSSPDNQINIQETPPVASITTGHLEQPERLGLDELMVSDTDFDLNFDFEF